MKFRKSNHKERMAAFFFAYTLTLVIFDIAFNMIFYNVELF